MRRRSRRAVAAKGGELTQIPHNASMKRPMWQQQGKEPDYRFSLANERTFLSWIRTALAIAAGAVVIHQFGGDLKPAWLHRMAPLALAACAVWVASMAYFRWKAYESAMRHDAPLPVGSGFKPIIGAVIAGAALLVWALLQA